MKTKKILSKVIAMILVGVLLFSIFPITALANVVRDYSHRDERESFIFVEHGVEVFEDFSSEFADYFYSGDMIEIHTDEEIAFREAPEFVSFDFSLEWFTDNPDAEVFTIRNEAELAGFIHIVNGTVSEKQKLYLEEQFDVEELQFDFFDRVVRLGQDITLIQPLPSIANNFMGYFDAAGFSIYTTMSSATQAEENISAFAADDIMLFADFIPFNVIPVDYTWYDNAGGYWGTNFFIGNQAQLFALATIVNGTAEGRDWNPMYRATIYLTADINLTHPWIPMRGFEGHFDGQGFTISGLQVNSGRPAGLFESIGVWWRDVSIRNLGINVHSNGIHHNVSGSGNVSAAAGGLAGYVYGSYTLRIDNVFVVGGNDTGSGARIRARAATSSEGNNVSASAHAGGLIGLVRDTYSGWSVLVDNSYTRIAVIAEAQTGTRAILTNRGEPIAYAGGFVGRATRPLQITHSYVTNGVRSEARNGNERWSHVGALVGRFVNLAWLPDTSHFVSGIMSSYNTDRRTIHEHGATARSANFLQTTAVGTLFSTDNANRNWIRRSGQNNNYPMHRIRASGVTVSPTNITVGTGLQHQLTATVLPSGRVDANNVGVTWSSNNTWVATVNANNGVVTALRPGEARVTVRTADGGFTATSVITVQQAPQSVTVSPSTASVNRGTTRQFTATVNSTFNIPRTVTWTVTGQQNSGTSINRDTGVLTVASNEPSSTLTVRATSTHDTSISGTATVTIPVTATRVVIDGANPVSMTRNTSRLFTARVEGFGNVLQGVNWQVTGQRHSDTRIDATGRLTISPLETSTQLTVRATSVHYPTIPTDTRTVNISAALQGSGTQANPYQIRNVSDMEFMREILRHEPTAHFRQMANIDMNGRSWTPILNFWGTFFVHPDDNFRITNLTVGNSVNAPVNAGLFANIEAGGTVRNITLYNARIIGSTHVGGITGINNGIIDNCQIINSSVLADFANNSYAGGIAGITTTVIRNSSNIATSVTADTTDNTSDTFAGGIVGFISASGGVVNSYNTGDIRATANRNAFAGGLAGVVRNNAGNQRANITNSFSMGTVTARTGTAVGAPTAVAGGLLGEFQGHFEMENSFSTADVEVISVSALGEHVSAAGGLIGRNSNYMVINGAPTRRAGSSAVINSYSASTVIGRRTDSPGALGFVFVGAIIGWEHEYWNQSITRTYADMQNVYFYSGAIVDGATSIPYQLGIPLNASEMRNELSFVCRSFAENNKCWDEDLAVGVKCSCWDFGNVWGFGATNNGFPVLRALTSISHIPVQSVTIRQGNIEGMSIHDRRVLTADINPANATRQILDWHSSRPDVVRVTIDGRIQALSLGTATITATSRDGGHSDSIIVNVVAIANPPRAFAYPGDREGIIMVELESYLDDGVTHDPNARIWYTLDNTEPMANSPGSFLFVKGQPIEITTTTYIMARAFKDGMLPSRTAGFLYTIRQSANPVARWSVGDETFMCEGSGECPFCDTQNPHIIPFGTIINFIAPSQGATIRYERAFEGNPAEVTPASPILSAIRLDRSMNINAIAYHPTRFNSGEVTFNFISQVAAPIFLPGDGSAVSFNTPVVIASETPGTQIRFSIDGINWSDYITSVPITRNTTIHAQAFKPGSISSEITIATITVSEPPPIVLDTNPSGLVMSGSSVRLRTDANLWNMVIRYTIDGSDPTEANPIAWRHAVGGGGVSMPVIISKPLTIRAMFFGSVCGTPLSDVVEFTFDNVITAPPAPSIPSGSTIRFDSEIPLVLSSLTEGARIHFELNGTVPTENSPVFNPASPIYFGEEFLDMNIREVVVRAIAVSDGLEPSGEVAFVYTVSGTRTQPVRVVGDYPQPLRIGDSPVFGWFISLDSEPGAIIHYTTNGTTPTLNSPVFNPNSPIPMSMDAPSFTVKAIATVEGQADSHVMARTFDALDPIPVELDMGTITVDVPYDVQFFGGLSLDLDLGQLPAKIAIEDGKVIVGIGFDFMQAGKFYDMKNAIDSGRYLMHPMTLNTVPGKPKPSIKVMGYLIGTLPTAENDFVLEGKLSITFEVKHEYNKLVMVKVVPVTFTLITKVSAGFSGQVGLIGENVKPKAEIHIIFPHMEGRVGVGVPLVANAGVYVNADINFTHEFVKDVSRFFVQGSTGAYAQLLFTTYRLPVVSGTIFCSTCFDNLGLLVGCRCPRSRAFGIAGFDDTPIFEQTPAAVYIAPRNYLGAQSPWLGSNPTIRPLGDEPTVETRTLQSSVYDQVAPQIVEANGTRVMVFLADDGSRNDMNRTKLMFSVYDGAMNTWSVPKPIDTTDYTSHTADFFPHLASDGANIWVTWHNSSIEFPNVVIPPGASEAEINEINAEILTNMFAHSEISVAQFDFSNQTFTNITTLTDNAVTDTQPKIAVNGNEVTVVWVRNTDNVIPGMIIPGIWDGNNNANALIARQFINGQWGGEIVLESGVGAIADTAVGYFGNEVRFVIIKDTDNNFETTTDRKMYVLNRAGVPVFNTSGNALVSNPAFAVINGTPALSWYGTVMEGETVIGGNIYYMTAGGSVRTLFEENDMVGDTFRIINNNGQTAVIYPHIEDGAGSFQARLYDNGWNVPFKLADTGGFARFFDGLMDANGYFNIVYNNSVMAIIGGELLESNDLELLRTRPLPNIRVTDVRYSHQNTNPGGSLPVTAVIENHGGRRVNSVDVYVNDVLRNTITIPGSLEPGGTAEVEFTLTMPSVNEQARFVIMILPNGLPDFDTKDNSYTLSLGAPNLTLSLARNSVDENDETGAIRITATVTNETRYPARANLVVRRDAADGEIIKIADLGDLLGGQSDANVDIYIDPSTFVPDGESFALLFFEVVSDRQEAFMANTSNFLIINAPHEVFEIALNKDVVIFEPVQRLYRAQTPERITVTNTGNRPTGVLNVELIGAGADNFNLSEPIVNNVGVGQVASFAIEPIIGLVPGTYTATVVVSGGNVGPQNIDISFRVDELVAHFVHVTNDGRGTASANPNPAFQGAQITVTAEPNVGYQFERWHVISGNVVFTNDTNNPATFTMPNSFVEIRALFEPIGELHNVGFNLDGGNFEGDANNIEITIRHGNPVSSELEDDIIPDPVRSLFVFTGWRYTGQDVNAPNLIGEQVAQFIITNELTFTAQWTPASNNNIPFGLVIPANERPADCNGEPTIADVIRLREWLDPARRPYVNINLPASIVAFDPENPDRTEPTIADVVRLLEWLDPARRPNVVLGPPS
jgi:hypothetical protein